MMARNLNSGAYSVDLTPSWTDAARMLCAVLEGGTAEGKRMARDELIRMGKLLDAIAEDQKKAGPGA